jgi:hypothetical protein
MAKLPTPVPPPPVPLHGVYGVSRAMVAPSVSYKNWDKLPAGVYGESMFNGFGVLGVVNRSFQPGPMAGLAGVMTGGPGGIGVFGHSETGWAGVFAGPVAVEGQIRADWIIADRKDAIVPFPDGSKRLLHCMESPEHWFEDFGSARLTRGRATVKLDADFAKVVTLNGYRVFLTPEGDCHGLYVRRRGSTFEVRELQGGTSNVGFSYRIVAKRKDIKRHTRFAKIDTTIPILKGAARAGRGRKTTRRPFSRRALFAALAKDARKKAT